MCEHIVLSYEEWRKQFRIEITEEAEKEMSSVFKLDMEAEIDSAIRALYQEYVDKTLLT